VAGEDEDDPPEILLATQDDIAFDRGLELFDVMPDEPDNDILGDGPLTARVWDDVVELKGLAVQSPAPSLEDAPGAAWLAIAASDLSAYDPFAPAREALADVGAWPDVGLYELARARLEAATVFVQGRSFSDVGARLVAETGDERGLRRAMVAAARRISRRQWRVDLDLGRDSLQLAVERRGLGPNLHLQIAGGRLFIDFGRPVGGVAEDLGNTRRYRDAERHLGGPPSLLIEDEDGGFRAARDDGRGTLRIVSRAGG
jgi:hypothetical protein